MSRVLLLAGLMVWCGSTLILSSWRRLVRPSLTDRLRPFHPGADASGRGRPGGVGAGVSMESLRGVLAPLVKDVGDRLASLLGVAEPLDRRLQRVHSTTSAGAFRLRQAGWAGAAAVTAAALSALLRLPAVVSLLMVAGMPILAFLVVEQRLASASEQWQRQTDQELPVVAEQLAMMVNAGFSLGTALARLAERSHGCIASDLQLVVNRVQQGLADSEALGEWSEVAGSEAVARLVGVLTLHADAADLGRLLTAEARHARRDLHRRTIERIERRSEQVWVPVTVATLVPGTILLAVPFLSALRLFANA